MSAILSLQSVRVRTSTNRKVLLSFRRSYIRNGSEASIDLHPDRFVDAFIFELLQAVLSIFLLLNSMSLVQKLLRTKQRPQVLCSEWWVPWSGRHGQWLSRVATVTQVHQGGSKHIYICSLYILGVLLASSPKCKHWMRGTMRAAPPQVTLVSSARKNSQHRVHCPGLSIHSNRSRDADRRLRVGSVQWYRSLYLILVAIQPVVYHPICEPA